MNFCGEVKCLNCGKVMRQNNTYSSPRGSLQFRSCDCGMVIALACPAKGYEFEAGLIKKEKEDKECSQG